jgi:transcriptional repressor NrdR
MTDGIRRRRECLSCERRFTTHERFAPADIRVFKARGRPLEEFRSEKIVAALRRVSRDDTLTTEQIEQLARNVEAELVDQGRASVHSVEIAQMVLERLRRLDLAAYNRFAANYMDLDGQIRTEPPHREREPSPQFELFETEGGRERERKR